MVAPRLLGNQRLWDSWTSFFFLLQLLLSAVGAKQGPISADFDVRPGGMVHSYSQNLGDVTCTFTYAAQGGTNEQWEMIIGVSEDKKLFSCSIWRPQGKSYLFFTQFKAEIKGAKIQHAMAYIQYIMPPTIWVLILPTSEGWKAESTLSLSSASFGGQNDVPLKEEEFMFTERAVSHREGKFHSELSKLMIVAEKFHDEL